MNKKLTVIWVFSFLLVLAWCSSKNVWDIDYDLWTEMWRQLHCSAMFQKAGIAELKWTNWVTERDVENTNLVEWLMETSKWNYYTTCIYPQNESEWNISISPADDLSWSINPAIQFCLSKNWSYSIEVNDTSIFWVCSLEDSYSCNAWDFYYWACSSASLEPQETKVDLLTIEDRVAACEERAWFYLNFGTWTFVWNDEQWVDSGYLMTGNVEYEKWLEKWKADVACSIDMSEWTVGVEFANHTALDASEDE